jgi:hypothetical protein
MSSGSRGLKVIGTKMGLGTQFFHAWATQRQRHNFIDKIKDAEGKSWTRLRMTLAGCSPLTSSNSLLGRTRRMPCCSKPQSLSCYECKFAKAFFPERS